MKNVVLIDYENLQIANLDLLYDHEVEIYIFTGPNQKNCDINLVQSAQKFGTRVKWISASRPGPNALDFHIAFYLGQLSKCMPKSYFHIVSKDKGFDALVDFMKSHDLFVDRVVSIENIPLVKKTEEIKKNPVVFVKNRILSQTKPAKLKTLQNAIRSWLRTDDEIIVKKIIDTLKKDDFLTIDEKEKVVYL